MNLVEVRLVELLMRNLLVHINLVDWRSNVQMIDKVQVEILNNDLNNLILISIDHIDHYVHLMIYQYVFHKNNLMKNKLRISDFFLY